MICMSSCIYCHFIHSRHCSELMAYHITFLYDAEGHVDLQSILLTWLKGLDHHSMAEAQHKLEELTLAELRDEVLSAEPQLASLIDHLSENQLKLKYRKLFRPEQSEKADPINAELTPFALPDLESSLQAEPPRRSMPRAELIRESLIQNVPEMKEHVREFSEEQLFEIYSDFCERNRGFPLSNDPKVAAMINEVLDSYPFLEDRITSYNEAQILKIHAALQAQRMRKGRTEHNPISVDALSQGTQPTRTEMRKEIKEKLPSEGGNAQKLTQEVEMMQQEENGLNNITNQCHALPNTILENQSQSRESPRNDEADRIEVWSMEHPQSASTVNARTYVVIHTQFEGAGRPRKMVKSDPARPCLCDCCKNNTIQRMCAQLISNINAYQK